jgi:hypothetical protein
MPIYKSDFSPTLPFKNPYFNTMYRPFFMKDICNYERERVKTWDNDFIDLDFSFVGSKIIALMIHGLEGSSESKYMASTSNHLNNCGFDTVCFNLRSCSGEDNMLLTTYHSGKTEDLDFILQHLLKNYEYSQIILIGFSLGGNLTLKYLGEYQQKMSSKIKGAVAISVPIDITSAEAEMDKLKNKLYVEIFFKTLKNKILEKSYKFPEYHLDKDKLFRAKKFKDLEILYTVPVFGFESPEDYWKKASSKPHLLSIDRPTLLINAKDDTFLSPACYPKKEAIQSDFFYLEIPDYGGHIGFVTSFKQEENTWLEKRIVKFISEKMKISIT